MSEARSATVSVTSQEPTIDAQAKAKTGVSHVRPLKSAARTILRPMSECRGEGCLLDSGRPHSPLSRGRD
jgi:hypothetical protein